MSKEKMSGTWISPYMGDLPTEMKLELIRAELSIRFPRFAGFVVEHRALDWADVLAVKWTDGPSLFDVRDLGLRERYETTRVALWFNGQISGVHIEIPVLDVLDEFEQLEQFCLGRARVRSCFVRYEREYSVEALESFKCTSPWLSYNYALLEETEFEEPDS